jgi:hypothetical protein
VSSKAAEQRAWARANPLATTVQPFANLNAALDALDHTDIKSDIGGALEDVETCESVETMADFKANLLCAAGQLKTALAAIEKLAARC